MMTTMPPAAGAEVVELLSALPYFDLDTGAEAISVLGSEVDGKLTTEWATQYLFDLAASGALEEVKELFRIPERVRMTALPAGEGGTRPAVRKALNVFVDRARSTLRSSLRSVLGSRGADVLVQTVDVVANPTNTDALNSLIRTMQEAERLQRHSDAANAVSILRRYVVENDRRLQFIEGLTLWQKRQKQDAASRFRRVLETRQQDRAEGIAAHLVAVYEHEHGDDPAALKLLRRSEKALKQISDYRGLCMTYTTHGRIRSQQGEDESNLRAALTFFAKAQQAADSIPKDDADLSLEATIRIHEAETLARLGEHPKAELLARQAQSSSPEHSATNLYATVTLARILRDSDQGPEALAELNENFISTFEAAHARDLTVAQAYNVLATIYLGLGDLEHASRAAELSVSIGLDQNLRSHLGHAYRTLATIAIEELGSDTDARQVMKIRSMLYRAKSYGGYVNDLLEHLPINFD